MTGNQAAGLLAVARELVPAESSAVIVRVPVKRQLAAVRAVMLVENLLAGSRISPNNRSPSMAIDVPCHQGYPWPGL